MINLNRQKQGMAKPFEVKDILKYSMRVSRFTWNEIDLRIVITIANKKRKEHDTCSQMIKEFWI